jgi:2-hydroxychromene-2-carboxylate isomerase
MIAFGGEPFFGQDRFDQFKLRLDQQGLKARA